jgi:oligoribonuclease
MATQQLPKRIIWLDLEMTGLDASADVILEVAAIITDWEFAELGTYEGIVRNDEKVLEERFTANGAFWSEHPDTKKGLVEQNHSGKSLEDIENELIAFIDEHFEADQTVLLGGNSVHMDRRFITARWPRLDSRLHYRMLDVSAWKVVFESKFGKRFLKPEAHRALEDIRGSIKELQYYLGKVKR